MRRKIMLLMLAFVMILPSLYCNDVNAASIYNRQKKNIFFVMDDSSSMAGKRENDANYSLQSLIAMCDREDKVNLYFLNASPNSPQQHEMSSKDNAMIENVRINYPKNNGTTPYNAVNVAKAELTASASKNDQTEYWLVVLTDGGFNDGDPSSDLTAFSQKPLANETYPNVLFVSIGGAVSLQSQGTLHYISQSDIVTAMNEAAKIISGRVEVIPSFSNDNKNITFNVPYPARNVIVFAQNKDTAITSYNCSAKLDISEKYNVEYPVAGHVIGKSTVCFVKEAKKSSIPAEEITFTFNQALDRNNTIVLVEPAIGLVAHYYNQDGQEVTPNKLTVGETVKVKYSICDSETKQELDASAVGGNVKYRSEVNGKPYSTNEFEFEVDSDILDIDLYAELPDGYVLNARTYEENLQDRWLVTFTLSEGGKYKVDYDKMNESKGINANVYINGNLVSGDKLDDFELQIKGENYFVSNFSVEKDKANGCFVIKAKPGWISPLTPKQKTYEVELKDEKDLTYTQTLNVEIPGERSWLPFILFLLGLYVAFCIISKKYFRWTATFTVWDEILPTRDDDESYPHEKRTIWKLYWYEFVAMFDPRRWSERDFRGWLHLIEFFFVPCGSQKVTMYTIAGDQFAHITLYAAKRGNLRVKDTTLKMIDGRVESDYTMIQTNRTTIIDFNKSIQKGLFPFSSGETLATMVDNEAWFIVYKK